MYYYQSKALMKTIFLKLQIFNKIFWVIDSHQRIEPVTSLWGTDALDGSATNRRNFIKTILILQRTLCVLYWRVSV